MNQLKVILQALLPIVLLLVLVNQIQHIGREFHRETPQYQISQERLSEVVYLVEQAKVVKYESIDTIFEPREQFPFGRFRSTRRRISPVVRYERSPLRLQGVLEGETPMAVVVDPSGATHFLQEGESILGREIRSITTAGVTVRDRAGTEVITVD